MLNLGIVGLPNVGKSTLFNALTAAGVDAENYPFCTVEPNVGTVEVPDSRVKRIHELTDSGRATPAFIQFVDVAGLVKGASKGEGLGNQFLAQIREVDAIAHVLRCFDDPDVTHVEGTPDPLRDKGIVETELALADLETVGRRLEKVGKKARTGEVEAVAEERALERAKAGLQEGTPIRALGMAKDELRMLKDLHLLTAKPVLYVANVSDEEISGDSQGWVEELRGVVEGQQDEKVVALACALEAELLELSPQDREEFLRSLEMEQPGLHRLVHASYDLLELLTFFTTNDKETRAWPVRRGTRAVEAAGEIHTDFQRGFIRAETVSFDDFQRAGSMKAARETGLIRAEGKDYAVQDGDIIFFHFNV